MQVPHLFANCNRIQLEIYRNRSIYPRISFANIQVRSSAKFYFVLDLRVADTNASIGLLRKITGKKTQPSNIRRGVGQKTDLAMNS